MHMKGQPKLCGNEAQYDDVLPMCMIILLINITGLNGLVFGIVGFGCGIAPEHSYELMRRLQDFNLLQLPMLVGISRKKKNLQTARL